MPPKRTSLRRTRAMGNPTHDNGATGIESVQTPPPSLPKKRTRSRSPVPIESARRSKRTAVANDFTAPATPSSVKITERSTLGRGASTFNPYSTRSTSREPAQQDSPTFNALLRKNERHEQSSVSVSVEGTNKDEPKPLAEVHVAQSEATDDVIDFEFTDAPATEEDDVQANEQLLREETEAWQRQEKQRVAMDEFVKKKYKAIHKRLDSFIKTYFAFEIDGTKREKLFKNFLDDVSPEFVRIAGQIADGGPGGKNGWQNMVLDEVWRPAFVCGLIGKVLNERVLTSKLFGGTNVEKDFLEECEKRHDTEVTSAGFCCLPDREDIVRYIASDKEWKDNLANVVLDTAIDIYLLLHPLLKMSPDFHSLDCQPTTLKLIRALFLQKHTCPLQPHVDILAALQKIVKVAAELNHKIRSAGHTVYYHPPLTKGMEYDPKEHYCISNVYVETKDPSHASKPSEQASVKGEGSDKTPCRSLVKIVVMEGCSAVRNRVSKSDPAQSDLQPEVLVRGRVAVRWGQHRMHGIASEEDMRQRLKDWPQLGDLVDERRSRFGLL